MPDLDRLLRGLSVYQDVVLDGATVRRGVRDCESRWQAIRPHLPASGTLLDIGANFGWFCLRWCAEGENRVAAAVEADLRSAAVQRFALSTHAHRRIALVTAKAGVATVDRFAAAGQRFDAVLCLSVLHWIPDHRPMLATLGRIADRIFVEHCDPREAGAGVETIRRDIGEIGPYLAGLFPEHRVERLARWTAHRSDELPRELWLVARRDAASNAASSAGAPTTAVPARAAGLDADALLDLEVAWPPRSWWLERLKKLGDGPSGTMRFTPQGLAPAANETRRVAHTRRVRAARRIPEANASLPRRRWRRLWSAVTTRLRKRLDRDAPANRDQN